MKILIVLSTLVLMVVATSHDTDCENLDWCDTTDPEHPFHTCVSAMAAMIQAEIKADCEAASPAGVVALFDNIKFICEFKNISIDPCCVICNFTGQECFEAMAEMIQDEVISDCEEVEHDPEALAELMENLNMICDHKNLTHLKPANCCDSCNFTNHECYEAMTAEEQEAFDNLCYAVQGTDLYQDLLEVANAFCKCKNLTLLTDPCDDGPTCDLDLCIIVVVDSSGSIESTEWTQMMDFLQDLVEVFNGNIAPDETKIGIIQYADIVLTKMSQCDGTSEAGLLATIDAMRTTQAAAGEFTATGDAIAKMALEFAKCCENINGTLDGTRFGIVMTDGKANAGTLTVEDAMDLVPADVTTIAIGLGSDTGASELEEIARSIPENNLHADDIGDLDDLIDDLFDLIC